jgi:hypothetical protein
MVELGCSTGVQSIEKQQLNKTEGHPSDGIIIEIGENDDICINATHLTVQCDNNFVMNNPAPSGKAMSAKTKARAVPGAKSVIVMQQAADVKLSHKRRSRGRAHPNYPFSNRACIVALGSIRNNKLFASLIFRLMQLRENLFPNNRSYIST